MTLAEALAILPKTSQEHIRTGLATLAAYTALGYRARVSLDSESRLSPEAWQAMFKAILAVESVEEPEAIRRVIIETFRQWVLKGPPLEGPRPTSFGRAVTLEYFCRLFVDLGYFGSVRAAKQSIRSLLLKPKQTIVGRWQNYSLGKYLMWSTFCTDTTQENPFSTLPSSADAIRGILGLDLNEKGMPLLLLVYTLPVDIIPRIPTVAEAYAGDKWNYFFTPGPDGGHYGLTMPWPEYENESPQPEVVHEVIKGGQIIAPLVRLL